MDTEPAQMPAEDLEKIFREHHALVFRAAFRITGNASDAEDVLQTVFMRMLRRAPGAETVENVESYLHRAAVNAGLDLMRSRQASRTVPLEDVEPFLRDNSSLSPDRLHAAGETRDWLRRAVVRLSPNAAEMFVLKYFEGKDNAEIAEALGTTQGTVAVTIHRTRDRMQKELRTFLGGQS